MPEEEKKESTGGAFFTQTEVKEEEDREDLPELTKDTIESTKTDAGAVSQFESIEVFFGVVS